MTRYYNINATCYGISTTITVNGQLEQPSLTQHTYVVPLPVAHVHTGQLYYCWTASFLA